LFEQPNGSDLFDQPEFTEVFALPNVTVGKSNACRFLKTCPSSGLLMGKEQIWVGNNQEIVETVSLLCTNKSGGDPLYHDHATVQGRNTKASGNYTEQFAHLLLTKIVEMRSRDDFERFKTIPPKGPRWTRAVGHSRWAAPRQVFVGERRFLDLDLDEARWREMIELSERMMKDRSAPYVTIEKDNTSTTRSRT
jgi:hypothetical protein